MISTRILSFAKSKSRAAVVVARSIDQIQLLGDSIQKCKIYVLWQSEWQKQQIAKDKRLVPLKFGQSAACDFYISQFWQTKITDFIKSQWFILNTNYVLASKLKLSFYDQHFWFMNTSFLQLQLEEKMIKDKSKPEPLEDQSVDIVIPYVDNTDPEWQERLSQTVNKMSSHEKHLYKLDDKKQMKYRFTQNTLLKYDFRAIQRYAPWIRKIHFLVQSPSQVPKWMNQDEVNVVLHQDFIPREFLPTFNANTIQTFLCRVPDLSQRFLYSNDDMMFSSKASIKDFFIQSQPRNAFNLMKSPLLGRLQPYTEADPSNFQRHLYCFFNSYVLAARGLLTDHTITSKIIRPLHGIAAFNRKKMEKIMDQNQSLLMDSITQFRSKKNFNQYLFIIRQILQTNLRYLSTMRKTKLCRFYPMQIQSARTQLANELSKPDKPLTICVNNFMNNDQSVNKLFQKIFPKKSKFQL